MGEQAIKIGKKLEGFGEQLFSGLGWTELARDREIKCKRSSHSKRTHGIDLLMKFKNPYIIYGMQGIIVECKNWQMKSINQSVIETWVKELINSIECAQSADELTDVNLENTTLNTGLLLVHANDNFVEEDFNNYLKGLKAPSRRNPINIFIASNREIDQWNSLFNKIKSDFSDGFSYVYPSINGSSKESGSFLNINSLYSRFIFAQRVYSIKENIQGNYFDTPRTQSIIFSLDDISIDGFKYLWSIFKYYQFEGSHEYVFVFYPRNKDDTDFVKENFIKTLRGLDKPIDSTIVDKIKIDFIDNRGLSPVDTAR